MIARGFKPVGWVAGVASAALGCYMLSLNVAAERAELAQVERQIIAAQQDIRTLETELGTRGRLAQLEQWNAEVLALSAPASNQFLQSEFTLASLTTSQPDIGAKAAEVRMASAEAPAAPPKAALAPRLVAAEVVPEARPLVQRASLTIEGPAPKPAARPRPALPEPVKAAPKPQRKVIPADDRLADIGAAIAAQEKKEGDASR